MIGLDTKKQITLIKDYENKENFERILNELVKSYDEENKIVGLYYFYKKGINKKSTEKYLFEVINKENYAKFLNLVNQNELSEELIDEIRDLEKIAPKKIKVDSKKIDISRKNLGKTVSMVNDFYEDVESKEEETLEKTLPTNNENNYDGILIKILDQGFISTDELESLGKEKGWTLNSFLSDINESLFDYIGDQTLIIEGEKVSIDEFYVDMIKELSLIHI